MSKHILNKPWVYLFSVFLARLIPLKLARFISKAAAGLSYYFCLSARRAVEDNLFQILGDKAKAKRSAYRLFLNYGIYLADWAKFASYSQDKIFSHFSESCGKEFVEEAINRGKGIILITAHLGNWEMGGAIFSHSNIPINIITGQDHVAQIAQIRAKARGSHNIKTITINNNSFFYIDIINALRRNEIVAMLVERYQNPDGVKVDFFGKPAPFPPGLVHLAKATGAAIMPSFVVMDKEGKYKAFADSLIEMEFYGDKDLDVKKNLSKIAKVFEKYIGQYPEQWYNFTPIW